MLSRINRRSKRRCAWTRATRLLSMHIWISQFQDKKKPLLRQAMRLLQTNFWIRRGQASVRLSQTTRLLLTIFWLHLGNLKKRKISSPLNLKFAVPHQNSRFPNPLFRLINERIKIKALCCQLEMRISKDLLITRILKLRTLC